MAGLIELNTDPDARTLQKFGVIALCGFGALALCAWREALMFSFGLGAVRVPLSAALAALAVLSALFSAVKPELNRGLYVGLARVTYPIGLVVSFAIMALLFFIVFAPVGGVLRALRRDPLQRAIERERKSYWTPARGRRAKSSYFRQY